MPIVISIAEARPHDKMTQFQTAEVESLNELIPYVTRFGWSPCVWSTGYRKKQNFLFSDLCALDFDNGIWSLSDAKSLLKNDGLAGIIGLTRSHQLPKKKEPPCDRFRIIIPWESRIESLQAYEQNMGRLMKYMPVDKACKDGARFFNPCTKIEYITWGDPLSWLPYVPPPPRKKPELHANSADMVPQWILGELQSVSVGQRNSTVFRLAIRLKERLWSELSTVDLFCKFIDLDRSEIERTVRSARRY